MVRWLMALVVAWPGAALAQPFREWPGGGQAGWSGALLEQVHAEAARVGSSALFIVQHGRVVDAYGAVSTPLELHSVRKSLLSALIGIAVGERKIELSATLGSLGIDDNAPSLTVEEKQATVAELLASRSGVYHTALYETEGERRNRPARGSHPHGSFWYYNNWDFNALGVIYERATGTGIFPALATRIAGPLGMQDYRVSDGRYVTGPESMIPAYPLRMSARDLARFGLLYLRHGAWGAQQVVPAAWVAQSTAAISLTSIPSGYGELWWTGWAGGGVPEMALPPGSFWADGADGQFVVVDPADDLLVVHLTMGKVRRREFGHLMWLIRSAAGIDAGADPGMEARAGRRRR